MQKRTEFNVETHLFFMDF